MNKILKSSSLLLASSLLVSPILKAEINQNADSVRDIWSDNSFNDWNEEYNYKRTKKILWSNFSIQDYREVYRVKPDIESYHITQLQTIYWDRLNKGLIIATYEDLYNFDNSIDFDNNLQLIENSDYVVWLLYEKLDTNSREQNIVLVQHILSKITFLPGWISEIVLVWLDAIDESELKELLQKYKSKLRLLYFVSDNENDTEKLWFTQKDIDILSEWSLDLVEIINTKTIKNNSNNQVTLNNQERKILSYIDDLKEKVTQDKETVLQMLSKWYVLAYLFLNNYELENDSRESKDIAEFWEAFFTFLNDIFWNDTYQEEDGFAFANQAKSFNQYNISNLSFWTSDYLKSINNDNERQSHMSKSMDAFIDNNKAFIWWYWLTWQLNSLSYEKSMKITFDYFELASNRENFWETLKDIFSKKKIGEKSTRETVLWLLWF